MSLPTAQLAKDLVNEITELISKNLLSETLSVINDNKYNACLKENSWDLIPVLTKHLDGETNLNSPDLFDCCQKLLLIVAEKSNPEEALLEFIEQCELAKEDTKFFAILKALQKTLLKLTSKRGRSLEWCLNTIQAHIADLPLPEEFNFEDEEKTLQDADEPVQQITSFYSELLPFYEPFIEEVCLLRSDKTISEILSKQRRDLIACFMLQLLGKPLACLDLEWNTKSKSKARICAEKIMLNLSRLVGNCFTFLEYINNRNKQSHSDKNGVMEDSVLDVFACDEKAPLLSLGVYYYILLSERVEAFKLPIVYSPIYVFQSLMRLVVELLKEPEQFVTRKGLLLAHALICSEMLTNFTSDLLDSPVHCEFCKNLTNIIIYSDVKPYRELGIKIFKTYLFKFDLKGRYLLISNLMEVVNHGNARGYLIGLYKEMLREILAQNENNISEYFSGQKFAKMLNVFCYLPEGAKSDLMELGDQIITTLNLMIYLAIRDKYNATGFWDHEDALRKTFFIPLKEGLVLSKAHYELKIKELKNEKGQGDNKPPAPKCALKVKGHGPMPGMSFENKKAVLDASLNSFEALEMLLARLEEIMEDGPPSNSNI